MAEPQHNEIEADATSARTERAQRREREREEKRMEDQLQTISAQMQTLINRIQDQDTMIAQQRVQMANQEIALQQHDLRIREQSTDLTAHRGIIDTIKGSKLTHLNVTEEALAIERAKNVDIYAIPMESGLGEIPDVRQDDPFLYQKIRRYKTLMMEFTPKLSRTTHVAEWYRNFEYMVKAQRIPTSIVRRHMVTTTFTPALRTEYLLVREIKELEENGGVNYAAVRRWIYKPEIGKYQVTEQMKKIFKWKQGKGNLLEAYDEYNLVVRSFLRELQFARENGVRALELDHPDETTLAKQFINNVKGKYTDEIARTCKLIGCPLNMALLKVICERVNTTKGGILGIHDTTRTTTAVKQETLVTERLEKKVDRVLEIFAMRNTRSFDNWQGRQGTGGRRNRKTNREVRRNNWSNNTNNGNKWNLSRRPRINKLQWAKRKCYHCKRPGHVKRQCWDLNPQLRKLFFERLRKNKNMTKRVFAMDLIEDTLKEEGATDPVEFIDQNWDQEEVFTFTNDEFTFEETEDIQEEEKDETPIQETTEETPTNETSEPTNDQVIDNRGTSLADFYKEIVSRSQPRQ